MTTINTRALQDYTRVIPPDGNTVLPVTGEFIFCKVAERQVRLLVDGQTIDMEAGDYAKIERFDRLEITNPDPERAVLTRWTIGFGEFDRKIVRGEISVVPGLRNEVGEWVPDTRNTVHVSLSPVGLSGQAIPAGHVFHRVDEWRRADGSLRSFNGTENVFTDGRYLIVLTNDQTGAGEYTALWFDEQLNLLKSNLSFKSDVLSVTRSIDDMSYHPAIGVLVTNEGESDAVQWVALSETGDWNGGTLLQRPGGYTGIAAVPAGFVVKESGGDLVLYSTDAQEIKRATIAHDGASIEYDPIRQRLAVGDGQYAFRYYGLDLQPTGAGNSSGPVSAAEGFVVRDRYAWGLMWAFAGSLVAAATRTFEIPVKVRAVQGGGCLNPLAGMLDDPAAGMLTTAAITSERQGATVTVTGECIRAALEWYFRRPVLDGYLDHVYGFTHDGDAIGAVSLPTVTGRYSFAALGIADDFTVRLPANVSITVDNALPIGESSLGL